MQECTCACCQPSSSGSVSKQGKGFQPADLDGGKGDIHLVVRQLWDSVVVTACLQRQLPRQVLGLSVLRSSCYATHTQLQGKCGVYLALGVWVSASGVLGSGVVVWLCVLCLPQVPEDRLDGASWSCV